MQCVGSVVFLGRPHPLQCIALPDDDFYFRVKRSCLSGFLEREIQFRVMPSNKELHAHNVAVTIISAINTELEHERYINDRYETTWQTISWKF